MNNWNKKSSFVQTIFKRKIKPSKSYNLKKKNIKQENKLNKKVNLINLTFINDLTVKNKNLK